MTLAAACNGTDVVTASVSKAPPRPPRVLVVEFPRDLGTSLAVEYTRWQSPGSEVEIAFLSLTASGLAALAQDRQSAFGLPAMTNSGILSQSGAFGHGLTRESGIAQDMKWWKLRS